MFPTPGPRKESGRREHAFLSCFLPPLPASASPSGLPAVSQQGERPRLSPQSEDPQKEVDGEGRGPAWCLWGERGRCLPIQCPSWMPLLERDDGSLSISKIMSPFSPLTPNLVLPLDFLSWSTQRSENLLFLFPVLHLPEPIMSHLPFSKTFLYLAISR